MMKRIPITANGTETVWWGANVTGRIYYAIRNEDSSNRATAWWILYGTGNIRDIGEIGSEGHLEIPITWWKGIVAARLRIHAGASRTIVFVSENIAVDGSVSFQW